jgi:hypothetical protein
MKAVKLLFAALAMTFCMNASAENFFNGNVIADIKFGGNNGAGGWGFGVGYQKPITEFQGCTLAWDVLNFEFNGPFKGISDGWMMSFKTGARLFSPSFWNDNLRGYTNLAMGYSYIGGAKTSAFGITYGLGLQFKEKFSFGYSLIYESANSGKCHFATFGWTF